MAGSSRLTGFRKLGLPERRRLLAAEGHIEESDSRILDGGGIDSAAADLLSENVIGVLGMPLAVAANFVVDGRDVVVPMSIEEPSVVAAASNAARLVREGGGFTTDVDPPLMIAQVEVRGMTDVDAALAALAAARTSISEAASLGAQDIEAFGGGMREVEIRAVTLRSGERIVVVHLVADCADAMGANTVNSMAEAAAPVIARIAGGTCGLKILSNLADRRLARARCRVPLVALGSYKGAAGADPRAVRDGVIRAWELADADPYRAATNNKGIMNGVDAVALATGNDWRALEAGAHSWAARSGRYSSLSTWSNGPDGELCGELVMPAAVGLVGGMTMHHPTSALAIRILRLGSARELAAVIACAGLATNLAALLALSTEGIQKGHMRLHARRTVS